MDYTPLIVLAIAVVGSLAADYYYKKSKDKGENGTWDNYPSFPLPYDKDIMGDLEYKMLGWINDHRQPVDAGIPDLILNRTASVVAEAHSQYMIQESFTSHYNAGARALYLKEAINSYDTTEIVTRNPTLEGAFKKFCDSNSHNKAMLDLTQTHVGIGITESSSGYFSVTVIFFKIKNK